MTIMKVFQKLTKTNTNVTASVQPKIGYDLPKRTYKDGKWSFQENVYTFTDKNSYLKWKDDWRAEYMKISNEIRLARANRKDPNLTTRACYQMNAAHLRVKANRMMEYLMTGKKLSVEMKNKKVSDA